jgi:hypothetical protein
MKREYIFGLRDYYCFFLRFSFLIFRSLAAMAESAAMVLSRRVLFVRWSRASLGRDDESSRPG